MSSSVSESMGAWCQLCTVCSTRGRPRRPAEDAAQSRGRAHERLLAQHVQARASALWMSGAWLDGGVQMSDEVEALAGQQILGRVVPARAGQRAPRTPRAGRDGSRWRPRCRTSGRPSHPGRCPWMATLPSPMTAPRSMLLEPVLADYRPRGPRRGWRGRVERGLFADDQRRVDAHRRRIGHRGEPAPEALLVERLRRRPCRAAPWCGGPRPARCPSIRPRPRTSPTHRYFSFSASSRVSMTRAHAVGVLDQVFLQDDLERGQPAADGERIAAVAWTSWRTGWTRASRLVRSSVETTAGQREAAAHALADGHDVGHDPLVVRAPHRARAPEAGDHLVGDEERAVHPGRSDWIAAQEAVGRDDVARGALHRLDDDGRDLARRSGSGSRRATYSAQAMPQSG